MRRLLTAFALGLTMQVAQASSAAAESGQLNLPDGKVHEVCKALVEGEQWPYRFTSEPALEFNVHYHVGDEVIFPVGPMHASQKAGTVTAELDQTYCLMWRNDSGQAATLDVSKP